MNKKKLDYKWVIVGLCFLMIFTSGGFASGNKSLYLAPITEALGIKRSMYSLNDSFRFITTSIVNLSFAALLSRFGTKKMICGGLLCTMASVLTYAFATNVYTIYVGGILSGIGLCLTGTTMVGSVINRWCKEKQGTIMGVVLAANGVGSAIAAQIISPIINEEGNAFGYRNAYKLVAVILFVMLVVIILFFRERPKDDDGSPAQVAKKKKRGQNWTGIAYGEVLRKPYFYLAAVGIFLTGFVLQGISGVSAAHMKDVGLDPSYVATVLSMHSLALTGFKLLIGVLYDKFGLRVTMTICDGAAFVAILSLALLTNSASGRVLAMTYGIISSLALPLETVMIPICAGDLFGQKSYNKILGLFAAINTAGYACGAPFMNVVFDQSGSYKTALFICCLLMSVVTIVYQFVISAAGKTRREIESRETA